MRAVREDDRATVRMIVLPSFCSDGAEPESTCTTKAFGGWEYGQVLVQLPPERERQHSHFHVVITIHQSWALIRSSGDEQFNAAQNDDSVFELPGNWIVLVGEGQEQGVAWAFPVSLGCQRHSKSCHDVESTGQDLVDEEVVVANDHCLLVVSDLDAVRTHEEVDAFGVVVELRF